jgi:branched-chain amino acid transport system substrate-binding protein
MRRRPDRLLALVLAMTAACAHAQAPSQQVPSVAPIVIGQSLPMSGPGFPIANRTLAGALTQVERVNANGGVHGRRIELVTLDDHGDARRTADNMRALVRQHGAVALVNCLGEQASASAAEAASSLGVPLIGPFSGAVALRDKSVRHVFTLRPDDVREAQALLGQLQAMGLTRIALLGDGFEPQRERALAQVLEGGGLSVLRVPAPASTPTALDEALRAAARAAPQALVLNLGPSSLEVLGQRTDAAPAGLPAVIATLSTAGLTQLTRLFRDRAVGFTSVVPNPEASQLPLVREFERDVDAHAGPEAMSFEGLAAYLHLRVFTEALRRAGPRVDIESLTRGMERLGTLKLGGWQLRFAPERHHGSDFVEIGLRTRDGRVRR